MQELSQIKVTYRFFRYQEINEFLTIEKNNGSFTFLIKVREMIYSHVAAK